MIRSERAAFTVAFFLAVATVPAAAAAPPKAPTPSPEKARAPKALPSHFTYEGMRVTVIPRGEVRMQKMSRVDIPKSDVTVVGLNIPTGVQVDVPFQVSFYIRNPGATTIAQVTYKVVMSLWPLLPGESGRVGWPEEGVIHYLRAGRDQRVVTTLVLPSNYRAAGNGMPIVVVIADPRHAIDEADEENNSIASLIFDLPDGG